MGNNPSAALAMGSATGRANKMMDDLTGGKKESSSEKMKSVKKEQAQDAAERKKRLNDRQKE